MTFLHRLANRIARLKTIAASLLVVGGGCSQAERVDFLSPGAGRAIGVRVVHIEPKVAAIQVGSQLAFSASARTASGAAVSTEFEWEAEPGTITSEGLFFGTAPGSYRVMVHPHARPDLTDTAVVVVWQNETDPTGIVVVPQEVTLEEGDTLTFSAFFRLANGVQASGAVVNWSSTGGQISGSGQYVAPLEGAYTIQAATGNGQVGSARVRVRRRSAAAVRVLVDPKSSRMGPGQAAQFNASTYYSDGKVVTGTYQWSATGGVIGPDGSYRAGTDPGTFSVIALGAGTGLADTATVTVGSMAPTLTSLRVVPQPVAMQAGASLQFTATGTWSDGSGAAPVVAWSATGGSISPAGFYTAGPGAGSFRVIAIHQGGTRADTANVTIQPPSIVALGVTPRSATVEAGGTQEFAANATWSDGSTGAPAVSWTATGGSISPGGVYNAGGAPGTYRVIATGGGKSDTAVVTVIAPVLLASLAIGPNPVQVLAGGTQQFSASAVWSNGSTALPPLSWSATGGTISASGLYTAGSNPGTFRVIGSGGGRADTSSVTVLASAAPPPPPLSPTANGCASPQPGWIWCDDFEQNRLSSYFEHENTASFARVSGVGVGGSTGMRARWSAGQVGAGNLKLALGRTPSSYMRPVDAGTAKYRELYWRIYVRNQSGWTGGGGDKLSRAAIMAGSNWQEAMIAHVWSGGTGGSYLVIDPTSGTDAAGMLRTTRYNDFPNLRWLGETPGRTALFGNGGVGQWYCVEAHAKLNTPGQSDGLMELWVNGVLDAQRTGINWVGSYSTYGINVVFFENYWNDGSPVAQERYIDDIVVSTERIGCNGSSPAAPPPPSPPPPAPQPPTLVSLSVTPGTPTLVAGATQQFGATAQWSDGSTTLPALNWSATGGTISSSGLFTAGATPGTYIVTANGGGRSASATISVSAVLPPPPPTPGAQPALVEDFSGYLSTDHYATDPFKRQGEPWPAALRGNRGFIELDNTVGLNAGGYNLSQAMRYNLVPTGACDEDTINLRYKIPGVDRSLFGQPGGQNVKDVWFEVWVRYPVGFSLLRPAQCAGMPADHKTFLFGFNRDGYGRADFHLGSDSQTDPAMYANVQYGQPKVFEEAFKTLLDGRWHQLRIHLHLGSSNNGTAGGSVWIDGVLKGRRYDNFLSLAAGYPADPWAGWAGITIGNNYSTPRTHQEFWIGRLAIWTTNPGW